MVGGGGGVGRSEEGGRLLLAIVAACVTIPACMPHWRHQDWPQCQELGGSSIPWLSPLPDPLAEGQGPACTIPGRFQPLAELHPTPTQRTGESTHAGWMSKVDQRAHPHTAP